jgi:hypothetical protein
LSGSILQPNDPQIVGMLSRLAIVLPAPVPFGGSAISLHIFGACGTSFRAAESSPELREAVIVVVIATSTPPGYTVASAPSALRCAPQCCREQTSSYLCAEDFAKSVAASLAAIRLARRTNRLFGISHGPEANGDWLKRAVAAKAGIFSPFGGCRLVRVNRRTGHGCAAAAICWIWRSG